MTKKFLALLLSFLFLFCACQKTGDVTESETVPTETLEDIAQENTTLAEAQTEASEKPTGANSAAPSKGQSNAPAVQPQAPKPQKPNTPQADATPHAPQEEVSLTPVPPTDVKPNPKKDITVTVSVDCHTAIEWGILEKRPEFQGVLPENGVILSTSVTVKEGESAMKALKKALKQNRIALQESDGYIRSISGLSEFDCGRASGWMYCVNRKFPNIASTEYPLKNGDKLEFLYTCKMGDIIS